MTTNTYHRWLVLFGPCTLHDSSVHPLSKRVLYDNGRLGSRVCRTLAAAHVKLKPFLCLLCVLGMFHQRHVVSEQQVGWPGVIVVEGEEASCESFVKTLRGWRWKHLAVRGEELVRVRDGFTVDEERRLPQPLQELGEKEGVSALAKRCREAGLEELFSTLLR